MLSKEERFVLRILDLTCCFYTDDGIVHAVDNVSIQLPRGDTLGIVGESGCGKSVTALSIMRLIPEPPGRIVRGEIYFDGRGDLLRVPKKEMRNIRGNEISMIFQEPMTSLNPLFTIGRQIAEVFQLHQKLSRKEALDRSVEMLKMVGIPAPEKRIHEYPHQMSGGMRQRAMIAMALSCTPKLMLADEPTTALDVTIQAQILELMNKLKEEVGTSIILITHDLGVIAEMAQRVAVMYAGVIVEAAGVYDLFSNPCHPYTKGLLISIPRPGRNRTKKERLNTIPGVVPSLLNLPKGCRFRDRCAVASSRCDGKEPELVEVEKEHFVRCWAGL
jgi:peptide/nickel transport system ATP-binding protein